MTEARWTVTFNFPSNPMFPNRVNGYQSALNGNVKTWADRESAESFAREKCGKYGWTVICVPEDLCRKE